MKPITVKELIKFLREQDQDAKVEVFDGRLTRYVYDIHDQTLITTKRIINKNSSFNVLKCDNCQGVLDINPIIRGVGAVYTCKCGHKTGIRK